MAFAFCPLLLFCVISVLLHGAWSFSFDFWKKNIAINNCPPGWTQFNCNCYIFQAEEREFDDAESVCQILGGNLASIHTDLENTFVQGLIPGDVSAAWIGYNDQDTNTDFVWTDGTADDFMNFDTTNSEPDDDGDCVTINEDDGLWSDADCKNEEAFVCIQPVDSSH
ncbi:lectin BRA-3-like [Vanacampus margaritifer]